MIWRRKRKRLDDPTVRFKLIYVNPDVDRSMELRVGDTVTFGARLDVNGQVIELEAAAIIERTS